jgi:hypothetical protein
MRNSRLNHIKIAGAVISSAVFVIYIATAQAEMPKPKWSDEGIVTKQGKKYPHPHTIHLEAVSQRTADFSIDEIKDWQGFLQSLNKNLNILPLSTEAKMTISSFKYSALNKDEKTFVITEINRILADEGIFTQLKGIAVFSDQTKNLEADYLKSKSKEDVKWLNRAIINDIFPQTIRIGKVKELKKMTCATCHEAWDKEEFKDINERAVMECFSKAIAGEKGMEECIGKAKLLKESRIEDPGSLKKFIQRSDTKGEIPFFVAVHPENPYTFNPLLKRLVCIECHSRERKVDKVMGRDGKVKDIPIFYGVGSEKPHKH